MKQYQQYDLEGAASRFYSEPFFIYDDISVRDLAKPGPRRRGITILIGKNGDIVISATLCHWRDTFERSESRLRGLGRAKGMIYRNMKDNSVDSAPYPAAWFKDLNDLVISGNEYQEVIYYAPLPMDHITRIVKRHLENRPIDVSDTQEVSVTVITEPSRS